MNRPQIAYLAAILASSALGLFGPRCTAQTTPQETKPAKVLRLAFPAAETGFDPVQISDLYSATITSHIFEPLISYDYLARPVKLTPVTAGEMPQVSSDFKTFTFHVRPGIYFTPDPAFKGIARELVAADYAYSIKRIFDPRWKSPLQVSFAQESIQGLQQLHDQALKFKRSFDYDKDIPGLQVRSGSVSLNSQTPIDQ